MPSMTHTIRIPLLLAVLLLSACASTRVQPPAPVVPAAQFKEAGNWQRAPAMEPVPDDWWTLFQDPVLDDLQQRLAAGNEGLKSALAALAGARASYEASRSAMQPTLSAGAGATRSAVPSAATAASVQNPSNSFSLSATASWEVDLWGRLAQASNGAQATLQASNDDLAAARLSAHALLAQTYFSLRTADAQLALLDRSKQAYEKSLDLTQARYDGGVVARTDVLQAQTQLRTTQAQIADMAAQRAQLEHAIAVLLGIAPSALTLDRQVQLPTLPDVPHFLPSTLLERRPDIAAAQRRVAATYAQIGVADAAYFPSLVLSANTAFRGAALARLVNAPNLLWSVGASLAENVFDGGQHKLASAQSRAAADQATATYRQTVLTSLQEVEDNLVLTRQLAQEADLLGDALTSSRRNLEITQDQYRAGTVSYLNVIVAQTSVLGSESNLLGIRNRRLAAVNQLLKNIAGRWEKIAGKHLHH